MEWFRWYHGTTADPKFSIIAKRSKQPRYVVMACWPALLEYSSSRDDRGTLKGLDLEEVAVVLDLETEQVDAIYQAMIDKGMIVNDRLKSWEKRQPKREDEHSYERLKRHRENKKQAQNDNNDNADETHDNADETHVTCKTLEQNREDIRTDKTLKSSSGETMTMKEFASGYRDTFGKMMPGGLNQEVRMLCSQFPRDKLIEAFSITAENGGQSLKYYKEVLKGKPKPTNRHPKTFETMKQENTLQATKDLQEDIANGLTGLESIFGAPGLNGPGVRDGSVEGKKGGLHLLTS
jgi:hypothetical protein